MQVQLWIYDVYKYDHTRNNVAEFHQNKESTPN